ncbi:MAG: hypothetical protein AB7O62_11430 [Pirellulales bacterium]
MPLCRFTKQDVDGRQFIICAICGHTEAHELAWLPARQCGNAPLTQADIDAANQALAAEFADLPALEFDPDELRALGIEGLTKGGAEIEIIPGPDPDISIEARTIPPFKRRN